MKISKYRKVESFVFSKEVTKELKLSYDQKQKLENLIDYNYAIIKYEKPPKTNPLWRITAPIFILLVGFLLLVSPVKWIFTGSVYYDHKGRISKMVKAWSDKMAFGL